MLAGKTHFRHRSRQAGTVTLPQTDTLRTFYKRLKQCVQRCEAQTTSECGLTDPISNASSQRGCPDTCTWSCPLVIGSLRTHLDTRSKQLQGKSDPCALLPRFKLWHTHQWLSLEVFLFCLLCAALVMFPMKINTQCTCLVLQLMQRFSSVGHGLIHHCVTSFSNRQWLKRYLFTWKSSRLLLWSVKVGSLHHL